MSALRAVRQLAATSSRLRSSSRSLARLPLVVAKAPVAQATLNVALGQVLKEELDYEIRTANETGAADPPDFLTNFQQDGRWTIQDVAGNDEVFLTRKFGDESIRVMFSIADLHNLDDEEYEQDEPAEGEDANKEPPAEFRVAVSIAKSGHPGALSVDLYCSEGTIQPATVGFYKSAKIGQELSIESDFARRTLYVGPPFEMLDMNLQENFERFLQDRGIDADLALFVNDYALYKEQKEYVQWLENVGKFVQA
ncbi:regulatory protein suaprga1 [Mycena galericulata]|nr:regulatory protein suaprga1 [Mycena galericulata]